MKPRYRMTMISPCVMDIELSEAIRSWAMIHWPHGHEVTITMDAYMLCFGYRII